MDNNQPLHTDPVPVLQSQPPTPEKKRSKKLLLAILVPLAVILIAGGSVAAFFFFWPKDSATTSVDSTPQHSGHNEEEMVDLARPLMDKIRKKVTTDLKATYPTMTDTLEEGSSPPYLVDGYEYRFAGDFGYASSFLVQTSTPDFSTDQKFAEAVNEIARTLLKEEGLTLKNTTDNEEEYQSDTLICGIGANSVPAYIRCADIWEYQMGIAATKPFADAYFASQTNITDKSLVVLGTPVIKDSKNSSYKTATVSISGYDSVGGAAGLFYSVNGEWKYFVSAQSIQLCSAYNTAELKTAFEGEACYDNDAQDDSTVKP